MYRLLALLLLLAPTSHLLSQSEVVIFGEINHREAYFTIHIPGEFEDKDENRGVGSFRYVAVDLMTGEEIGTAREIEFYSGMYRQFHFIGLHPGREYALNYIENPSRPFLFIQVNGSFKRIDNNQEVKHTEVARFSIPPDWQYRFDAPDFSFVAGSCSYINDSTADRLNQRYGGEYEIYSHMAREDGVFNLWLGDNIYLRPSDYSNEMGIENRYHTSRNNVYLQMLLSSRPNLAIWDDHDAGPNNCLSSYPLMDITRREFKLAWPRAKYGADGQDDLTWLQSYSDVVFIGLDNRTYRTHQESSTPQILGRDQIDWLTSEVRFHRDASFVVICLGGQVLNSTAHYENYANYPDELSYLIEQLKGTGCGNIIFLTGDRHHSEMSLIEEDGVRLAEFTVSPMTAGPSDVVQNEVNDNRVGDYIDERNYAVIQVSGDPEHRKLTVIYKDVNGEEISRHEIDSL